MDATDHPSDRTRRVLAGAVGGAAAFLVTVVVTTAVGYGRLAAASDPSRDAGTLAGTLFPPLWKSLGWLVFGAHGVAVRSLGGANDDAIVSLLFWLLRGSDFPPAVPLSPTPGEPLVRNVLTLTVDGVAATGALLVPPVVLTLAGVTLGRRVADDVVSGGAVGLRLAAGYLPPVVLLAVATRARVSGYGYAATVGVSLLDAALVAGVAYPVVFGGVGGLLSQGVLGDCYRRFEGADEKGRVER